MSLLKSSESNMKTEIRNLENEAYPPDPEQDNVFGKEDIGMLKVLLKDKGIV